MRAFLSPHRIVLIAIGLLLVVLAITLMNWSWLANPKYQTLIVQGIWRSIWLTFVTMAIGMVLAIPIGLAQAVGPWYLAIPARVFCTVIRGTPLLMQIWLLYYGLGSLFPGIPGIRDSVLWPILRQAWPYAVVALSLSVAGYEGEVMRGAFKGVPHGQLESGQVHGHARLHHVPPHLAAPGRAARPAHHRRRDRAATEIHPPRLHHHRGRDLLASPAASGRTPSSSMNRSCCWPRSTCASPA